jgi:hypothetical protein
VLAPVNATTSLRWGVAIENMQCAWFFYFTSDVHQATYVHGQKPYLVVQKATCHTQKTSQDLSICSHVTGYDDHFPIRQRRHLCHKHISAKVVTPNTRNQYSAAGLGTCSVCVHSKSLCFVGHLVQCPFRDCSLLCMVHLQTRSKAEHRQRPTQCGGLY